MKGSRTLFWQRERLEQPGSAVTRGEGAQTETHRCSVPSWQTGRALQSVTAWNVLKIQGENLVFWSKKGIITVFELRVKRLLRPLSPSLLVVEQRCKCEPVE